MKRVVFCLMLLAACSSDDPEVAETTTTTATIVTTTAEPTTTIGPKVTATTLIKANAQMPAAGACAQSEDEVAEITLNPDVPMPRCTIVGRNTKLKFINNTDELVAVDPDFAPEESLHPNESHLFPQRVGDYWEPGVHSVRVSLYAGGGAEIWLK